MTDKAGKKSKKTAAYTYDLLGRIKKETKIGREDISYTYDSNNNRKEMKAGNKITAYKYNKNDELLRTDTLNTDTEKDKVVIYKNDKNGNQLATVNRYEIPSDKKDSTYVDIDVTLGDNRLNENVVNHYNALNQLTQTLTKNYKVSFAYDAEGLRTSKTVNGEKTVFVWDGDQLVMELSESGKVQKRYIRGNDLVYADKGENTEKQYYVTDPHGNVVQLTDENGKVIKIYEYDSFGNEVDPDGKDDNPFRYCGEYYDKEIEEIYLRARYYQPAVGRFLTRDSYTGEDDEPLSLHLYTYCYNNPIYYIDYTGNRPALPQPGPAPMPTSTPAIRKEVKRQNKVQYSEPIGPKRKCHEDSVNVINPTGHKSIKKIVWDYFRNKKFTKKQVAGIMGNVKQESDFHPLLRDNESQYWGLFQISRKLSVQLEKKYEKADLNMKKYGYNVSTYQTANGKKKIPKKDLPKILKCQLDFIYDCKPTEQKWIKPLKKAKSVEEATEIFLVKFEGATSDKTTEENRINYYSYKIGKYYQETAKRRKYAKEIYKKYK